MSALARWCLSHRLAVVLLWLLALVGVGGVSAAQGSVFSDDYSVPGTESAAAAERLEGAFPDHSGGGGTVVFHSEQRTVQSSGVEQPMSDALDRIAELPGVADVQSPYQVAGSDQVSQDGHTGYATVTFDAATSDLDQQQVQQVVDTAKTADGDGLQVELTGGGFGGSETGGGSHVAEMIGIAAAGVVLFLVFGSLLATLLPLVTALVSVGIAYALIGLLSHLMTVASFAPMLGTLIGLGVGIDYALFILTRHRRGLREGLSVREATVRAVTTSGRAVVFAGVTVCIALLGMLVLRLSFLNGVAIAASLTVLLTVLASITLLPALLGVIGTRVLGRKDRRQLAADELRPERPGGFSARWSALVERRPRLLGGVAAALMLLLALPALSLQLGTSDQGNDPAGSTTREGYELLADGFGPGFNGPLTVVGEISGADDRAAFDALTRSLENTEGVAQVSPAQYDSSGDTGQITIVPQTAPQSEQTSDLVEQLRGEVLPEANGSSSLQTHVGGMTAGYDDFAEMITGKLPLFCGVVVALGSALLLLAFRSLAVPLKAALMNVLAVIASFGVVVAVFQLGWGSGLLGLAGAGPIEPFLPVIMISVLFGLSMDYQVFLLSRMYEEWRHTGDNRRAVRVGLAETSRVINSAAVIMIAVFGAFVFSGDRIIAMFGVGLATAVALDAFVLRTLLVPALMHLLGGANWWLPDWLERRLPKLSIEPPQDRPEPVDEPPTPDPTRQPAGAPLPAQRASLEPAVAPDLAVGDR